MMRRETPTLSMDLTLLQNVGRGICRIVLPDVALRFQVHRDGTLGLVLPSGQGYDGVDCIVMEGLVLSLSFISLSPLSI